ncbi:MAG: c-type cytochrome biogenesis protein CcmI, partial [Magnetospirillum sp.]|nr:c-type cytochrome biogenesis protein CcmI [Magnetospirillum sp.]
MIWIIFAAMLALTLAVLLRPLLSKSAPLMTARADYDLMVYKDQLAEISRDIERGLMNADQAASARTEIQRRMLAAGEGPVVAAAAPARRGMALVVVIVLGLPLLSLATYLAFGA